MKSRYLRIALPLLAVALTNPATAADYVSTVTSTNPLAYFQLNGNDQPSTNGAYTTSYANVGTSAAGTGAPIAANPANAAASFDGFGSDSIVTTSVTGSISARGSINAWVNLAQLPAVAGRIFYIAGESQFGNDFDFQIESDNQLRFFTGSGENTAAAFDPSLIGQWVMVTASYDATLGSGSFRRVYINGALAGSYSGLVSDEIKTAPFTVGYSPVFGNREFAGLIDEVAVWDRGLSDAEVSAIYASRGQPAVASVPEPATWAAMVCGFGMIGASARRRAKTAGVVLG